MTKSKLKVSVSTDGTNFKDLPENSILGKALNSEENFERKFIDKLEKDHDPGPLSNNYLKPTNGNPKIVITKGKLLKGDKVEIEYTKQDGPESKPAECSEKHTDPPRAEFKNAFGNLAIHAALIGEFIPLTSVDDISQPDPEKIKDFTVTGFTIHSPGDDDEGVIITDHKTLKSGKALGFNTPLIRINDESDSAYDYLDELGESIEVCKKEIIEYLSGKYAADPQGKLFE